jgi:hypothetical protein
MAPRVGFEPTTSRLTAGCSTTELPRNIGLRTWRVARGVPISSLASETTRDALTCLEGNTISPRSSIRFAKRHIPLPGRKPLRIALGITFLVGGALAILPLFGLWMLPVGLLILSVDLPWARRWRRRMALWWGRFWRPRPVRGLSRKSGRPESKRKKGPSG